MITRHFDDLQIINTMNVVSIKGQISAMIICYETMNVGVIHATA